MSTTRTRLAAAAIGCGLAVTLVLPLAGAAWAQDAGASQASQRWGDPAQMKARMQAHRQRRQQVLHDALGLRPDQEGAWQAFVADSKPVAREDDREHGRRGEDQPDRAPLTTPERLDRLSQRIAALQARLAARAAAIKRFYAALDPRQQKTFDALYSLARHDRFGHGWRG